MGLSRFDQCCFLGRESDVYLRSLYWWFLVIAVCLLQAGILGNLLIARCVLVRICISLLDAYSYAYAYGQGFLGVYKRCTIDERSVIPSESWWWDIAKVLTIPSPEEER